MLPRRFKEARAEFIVSAATKREEGRRERRRGNTAAGCDPSANGGNAGSVMADEGLDGSRDKLRRDLATTGIDPPRAESRVLPSEPRSFVCLPVTVESIDGTIVFGETESIAISLEIPLFAIWPVRRSRSIVMRAGSFVSYRCYLIYMNGRAFCTFRNSYVRTNGIFMQGQKHHQRSFKYSFPSHFFCAILDDKSKVDISF